MKNKAPVEIRLFCPENLPEVSELIRRNQKHDDFPDDYIRRIIMDDYNFDPELHLVARSTTGIAGFASHGFTTLLDFGPVGTHPDFRRKGIASVLTRKILGMIKKLGVEKAFISWVGPVCFYYQTISATISRIYWVMAKGELPEVGVEHICEI